MGQGASVGFHAAYILGGAQQFESGSGNAILGAYLNQLGLSEDAILYVTKTAPTSIQWMSLRDANEQGIAVAALSPQQVHPADQGGGDCGEPARRKPGTPRHRFRAFAARALVEAERRGAAPDRGPVCGDRLLQRQIDAKA